VNHQNTKARKLTMSTANTAQHNASESHSDSAWWSHVMGRIGRFIEAYIWLSKDAFLGKMWRVIIVAVLSFLGASAVSGTLVLLSIYIKKLESGEAGILVRSLLRFGLWQSLFWFCRSLVRLRPIFVPFNRGLLRGHINTAPVQECSS
jgi:hypothetical protein